MAEFDPIEEKALLYVLGELPADAALEFEARMEEAPELRKRVRELEEGAVALAQACPPKQPPKQVWTNIEKAIESERRVTLRWEWFRDKGWPAAAACLVGWLIYAFAAQRPEFSADRYQSSQMNHARSVGERAVDAAKRGGASRVNEIANASTRQEEQLRQESAASVTAESEALRKQIGKLQRQLALISQSVTQQQALLNDPARLKFVGLTPVSNGAANATAALSPQLQRALALAMARELGWLGMSNEFFNASPESFSRGGTTNIGGVDFVDFRANSATNGSGPAQFKSSIDLAATTDSTAETVHDDSSSPGLLPAFINRDHVSFALDNSVAPTGSQITLTGGATGETQQVIGTLTMSGNPTVVTFYNTTTSGSSVNIPLLNGIGDGWVFTVNSVTPAGGSNQFQFISLQAP